ncbi:hypothetical protein BGX21_011503 [Mortierella sp. AD011]|nr:hypothetical protein BGX21_011503 [Mortierella sp. AD011]
MYPSERLSYILSDASPSILLADSVGLEALGEAAQASLIIIDPSLHNEMTAHNPCVSSLRPHHLAYIIYTSGSTGKPKGVMTEHAHVSRLFDTATDCCQASEHDVWSMSHSFSFDFSVWEMWGALGFGGKLVLVPYQTSRSPQDFYNLACQQRITILNLTPSAFKLFAECQQYSSTHSSPRYVVLAGEALPTAILQPWYATHSDSSPQIVNMYGPTECTIYSTYHHMKKEDCTQVVGTIGRHISDAKTYVLDANGRPVPIGAPGELHISGGGVTRGYLNRPELTAEKFIPDPFSKTEGSRMYKTGDLVRYLSNSNIMYLGRDDDQVKIRGFRIELGEIEACLAEHPAVSEAIVVALSEEAEKSLVAYVTASPDEQLPRKLRSHLASRLPEYMIPSAFVRLDSFPLTANGKLDRHALPAPDEDAIARQIYEAPQGEMEMAIMNIWVELLGVERIGRHDGFFILGGHSLLAVKMINRIRTILGFEMSLRTLFEAPTIAELATRLLEGGNTQNDSYEVLLPIRPHGTRPPLFCVHPGFGLSWCYIGLSAQLHKDQPIYGLQARGFFGNGQLPTSLDEMALDYLDQIRSIQPHGPYHLLGYSLGGSIAHTMAAHLEQQGERVALLAVMDTSANYYKLPPRPIEEDKEEQHNQEFLRFLAGVSQGDVPEMAKSFWEYAPIVNRNLGCLIKPEIPPLFSGDIFIFHATLPDKGSDQVLSTADWKQYVLGNIEVYDIHCTHNDMEKPEHIAEIGRVLAPKLDGLYNCEE